METRQALINAIINYFEENEQEFIAAIEELDSYMGYLGDDRYYNMYELDELLYGLTPSEILARTFYGGDADTKDQNGILGEFNPNREYFYYNGYGNLVSTDYKDNYSYHLDEYFVNALIEYGNYIDLPEEVNELIEKLEEVNE